MPETLKKELRKLEPEQKIKVGSKGGSMFWYVGTADDLLKNLPVYNAYCELFIKTALKNANNRLKSALATYPTLEEYAKFELAMTKPDLTVAGYEAAVAAWFNNIIHLNELKAAKERWLNEYIKINERQVVEVEMCDPAADSGVIRIVVKGHESGKYWMYNEAKRIPSCAFINGKDDEEGDEEE